MNVLTLDLWEDWLLLRAYGGSGRMVADAPGALTKASAVLFASGAVIVPLASIDGFRQIRWTVVCRLPVSCVIGPLIWEVALQAAYRPEIPSGGHPKREASHDNHML
jgi:hypothetical protein